jgi:hypothetical protein
MAFLSLMSFFDAEGAHQTLNCTHCALRLTLVREANFHNGTIVAALACQSGRNRSDNFMKLVARKLKSAKLEDAGNLRG